MPAGIDDAYKSPFHKSCPSSVMFDLGSCTRSNESNGSNGSSSSSGSIRNEYFHPNGSMSKFASFQPQQEQEHVPDFNQQYKLPDYQPSARYPALHPYSSPTMSNGENKSETRGETPCEVNCEDLVNRVLSNKKCRQLLKRFFTDTDVDDTGVGVDADVGRRTRSRSMIDDLFDSVTFRQLVIYCLGGLIILCILDFFVQLGILMANASVS